MRPAARLLAVALLAAVGSCHSPVDLESADLNGTLVAIDAVRQTLGVRSDNRYLVALPPGYDYDYIASVPSKVLLETASGFREISLDKAPANRRILIWTTGVTYDTYPMQVSAVRVVIRAPE